MTIEDDTMLTPEVRAKWSGVDGSTDEGPGVDAFWDEERYKQMEALPGLVGHHSLRNTCGRCSMEAASLLWVMYGFLCTSASVLVLAMPASHFLGIPTRWLTWLYAIFCNCTAAATAGYARGGWRSVGAVWCIGCLASSLLLWLWNVTSTDRDCASLRELGCFFAAWFLASAIIFGVVRIGMDRDVKAFALSLLTLGVLNPVTLVLAAVICWFPRWIITKPWVSENMWLQVIACNAVPWFVRLLWQRMDPKKIASNRLADFSLAAALRAYTVCQALAKFMALEDVVMRPVVTKCASQCLVEIFMRAVLPLWKSKVAGRAANSWCWSDQDETRRRGVGAAQDCQADDLSHGRDEASKTVLEQLKDGLEISHEDKLFIAADVQMQNFGEALGISLAFAARHLLDPETYTYALMVCLFSVCLAFEAVCDLSCRFVLSIHGIDLGSVREPLSYAFMWYEVPFFVLFTLLLLTLFTSACEDVTSAFSWLFGVS